MAKKWADYSSSERVGIGCAGVALIFIVAIITSIATTDVGPAKSIAAMSSEVKEVITADGYLNVDVQFEPQLSGKMAIYNAADFVRKAITTIQAGATDANLAEMKGALFTFSVPTVSTLGREGRADLVNISMTGDDLRKAKPDNMSAFDIIEVAKIDLPSMVAEDSMRDYCASNEKFSPRYCGAFWHREP